jgi:hypothetical protein
MASRILGQCVTFRKVDTRGSNAEADSRPIVIAPPPLAMKENGLLSKQMTVGVLDAWKGKLVSTPDTPKR